MIKTIDERMLRRRFLLVTGLMVTALLIAGAFGLQSLGALRQRTQFATVFSHLGEMVVRLDLAVHHAVSSPDADVLDELRAAFLDALDHYDEVREARVQPVLGAPAVVPRDAGLGTLIDAMVARNAADVAEVRGHVIMPISLLPADLTPLWKDGADHVGIEHLLGQALLAIEHAAVAGVSPDSVQADVLSHASHHLLAPALTALHQGSALMMNEHEAAGEGARNTLLVTLGVGTVAALANFALILLPLARRIDTDRVALASARDRALAGEKAKAEFLATMSHELRTPLNGVIGMASVLEGAKLDTRARTCVGVIRSSGEALLTVIADILEFSQFDTGRLKLDTAPFDTDRVVTSAAAKLAPAAAMKGLDLVVRVDPTAPARLVGDSARLEHVVTNLISNAVKFTPAGTVTVDLSAVRDGEGGATLAIEVRDTGVGVRPEDAEVIFGLFTQADQSATRRAGGVGLGLAMCRTLLDMMGGSVRLLPAQGPGATFRIELRLPIDDDAPIAASDPTLTGASVIVVSAIAERRAALAESLRALGLRTASRAPEDAALPGDRPDIVIIDEAAYDQSETEAAVAALVDGPHRPAVIALVCPGRPALWEGATALHHTAAGSSLREALLAARGTADRHGDVATTATRAVG